MGLCGSLNIVKRVDSRLNIWPTMFFAYNGKNGGMCPKARGQPQSDLRKLVL